MQSANNGLETKEDPNSDLQIEMKNFIKIFEKDSFSEKAIKLIKEECKE